ncbi:hypothetical protein [Actinorugispora endophytica]|uniref:AAA domain-containing protein n=1 Tax=Actinorugispora endophytica TaxID=1605990 RepID=A0A4R6V491_9ACTN|nr:hypothetical protein [Actinorugispora endophytica]TDQ55003.1 hypothetical protein EV190_101324 [Actinorugispora endophytica]
MASPSTNDDKDAPAGRLSRKERKEQRARVRREHAAQRAAARGAGKGRPGRGKGRPGAEPFSGDGKDTPPPVMGWAHRGGGASINIPHVPEYQATTAQACGLFPFVTSSKPPAVGTPIGRDLLSGEVVCLDPLAWLRAGLVTNPGCFVLGQPGTGKSTLVKRMVTGAVAFGTQAIILGDTKPDYTSLIQYLGGQVVRIGRGLDRINPLDAGPLGTSLAHLNADDREQLRWEVRSRRISLLMALCTLIREDRITNAEEVVLGAAVDLLDERLGAGSQPTVVDVLRVVEEGPDDLRRMARAESGDHYDERVDDLVFTLRLLCTGSLAGVFDGPTTNPIDLSAPGVSVDISRVGAAGDKLLTAAMLCTWSYGFGMVDAAAMLAEHGVIRPRSYIGVMDELWRALRGAPGLVEYADSLTRLNRSKGMASVMVTHSLSDLEALASEEDRAKARGFVDRSAITILAGLPPRELARVNQITPLTEPEQGLVSSWSSPDSWQPGTLHPGRGRYLIKTGAERLGIPVQMTLTGDEFELYDTDQAIRRA